MQHCSAAHHHSPSRQFRSGLFAQRAAPQFFDVREVQRHVFTFSEAFEDPALQGHGQLREALQAELVRVGPDRCLALGEFSPIALFGAGGVGNIV